MSRRNGGEAPIRKRQSDLKMSFNLALRSLVTTCSKQELSKTFSDFTSADQEHLPQFFIQVIATLHGNIEVGTVLDTVEQLVEEQCLDPLFLDKLKNTIASSKLRSSYIRIKHEKSRARKMLIS